MTESKYTRDQIFDKVRKLLELANHEATNENQAAAAAAKAQELMTTWAIEENELEKLKGTSTRYSVSKVPYLRRKRETWEDRLFRAVAHSFIVHSVSDDGKNEYNFAGRADQAEVAAYSFEVLRALLDKLSKVAYSAHAAELKQKYGGKSVYKEADCRYLTGKHPTVYRAKWIDSWLLGAQYVVTQKLDAQREEQVPAESTALVVVETRAAEAKEYAGTQFNLIPLKPRKPTVFTNAYELGKKEGAEIALNKGITADKRNQLA